MQIGDRTFVNVTQAFPDITRKYCGPNTPVVISGGICRTIENLVSRKSGFTNNAAIDHLLMGCLFGDKSVLIDRSITMRRFNYVNDTEVWAYAQEDHLGRTFVKILLPSETRQGRGNRRSYRRNHNMEVTI